MTWTPRTPHTPCTCFYPCGTCFKLLVLLVLLELVRVELVLVLLILVLLELVGEVFLDNIPVRVEHVVLLVLLVLVLLVLVLLVLVLLVHPLLHHVHVKFQLGGLPLIKVVGGKGVVGTCVRDQVFLKVFLRVLMMGLLAVSWCTLICTMNTLVQLVLKMFRGVVSVGVSGVLLLHINLLSLCSLDEHLHGNLLRLAC